MRDERRDGRAVLGEQHSRRDACPPQHVPVRAVHTPGDLRAQAQAAVLQGGVQVSLLVVGQCLAIEPFVFKYVLCLTK